MQMKREDYKAVKHMNKDQLTNYLQRVYTRGYEAGLKAMTGPGTKKPIQTGLNDQGPAAANTGG
jgi:hypothetical protein